MNDHPRPRDRELAIEWARELMNRKNFYVLDTETTGLGNTDEVVQVGIINKMGEVVLETLLKPRYPIPPDVIEIHGITNDAVVNAPKWTDIYVQVSSLLAGEVIVAYNVDFDRRMLDQTCAQYGLPALRTRDWLCAMKTYARYFGKWDSRRKQYVWQNLGNACQQQQIRVANAHSAVGDVQMTLALIQRMAGG